MKQKYFLILASCILLLAFSVSAFAEPERLKIKDGQKRNKELSAQSQIKNVYLKKIQDPEARKAIGELFNYLNLQTKK